MSFSGLTWSSTPFVCLSTGVQLQHSQSRLYIVNHLCHIQIKSFSHFRTSWWYTWLVDIFSFSDILPSCLFKHHTVSFFWVSAVSSLLHPENVTIAQVRQFSCNMNTSLSRLLKTVIPDYVSCKKYQRAVISVSFNPQKREHTKLSKFFTFQTCWDFAFYHSASC